jgi:membrane-associated phospholipid phosphatase
VTSRIADSGVRARAGGSPAFTAVGTVSFLAFLILAVLVQDRRLVGIDQAVTLASQIADSTLMDFWGAIAAIGLSSELSLVFGVIGALLLWRSGLGGWALAPLAFLILVPLEIVLKATIHQAPVPPDFYHRVYYPLMTVTLDGSFPSGHAMRSAFFGTFLLVLLLSRGHLGRLTAVLVVLITVLAAFSRIYLGYHWFSDVVGGLLLGVGLALLVAPHVAARLAAVERRCSAPIDHPRSLDWRSRSD